MVTLIVLLAVGIIAFGDSESPSNPGTTVPGAAGSTSSTGATGTSQPQGQTTSSTAPTGTSLPPLQSVELELVFDGFRQPTVLTAPPGDDRLFVAQRVGVIRILDANRQMLDPAFLDITDRVLANGIEQGLLGLAFHPDFADNGRFFVYYTDDGGRRQLSEFNMTVDPNRADAGSEKVLIELDQPPDATDIRHYAGNVQFGPDGYLWVSLGDGADSRRQGQDPFTLFGTVIRIDVDNVDPYGVPEINPFVAGGGAPEVWAYGLRNPWRFAIDPVDRLIYIADVGHSDQEEVNVLSIDTDAGANLGWSDMEGTRCFHRQDCDAGDYTSPVLTYGHDEGLSITGGFVYRGAEIPELHGVYFYSDWVFGFIRSFRYVDGQATEQRDWTEDLGFTDGSPNSYGLDGHGELYLVTHEGQVYKFTARR